MQHDGRWTGWGFPPSQAAPGSQEQQDALRTALLQRIADRLGVARYLDANAGTLELAPCCWIVYSFTRAGGRVERWAYQLCGEDCAHWHHQIEIAIALGSPVP